MTAVIILQALLFQDGGLLVMGWNVVNMGALTIFTGAAVYGLAKGWARRNRLALILAGGAAAWLSTEAAAVATAMELAASGTSPLGVAMPALVGVHALIGVGEAIITVGALLLIFRTRPDLLKKGERAPGQSAARWATAGLIIALVVAAFSFAASGNPDGLERVAEDEGFIDTALEPLYEILPDYTIPFIGDEKVSGIIAVLLGTLIVFGLVYLTGRLVRQQRQKSRADGLEV
jgi:cobalt/nickel transport system permease protein